MCTVYHEGIAPRNHQRLCATLCSIHCRTCLGCFQWCLWQKASGVSDSYLFVHSLRRHSSRAWFPIPIWIDFGLSFFAMIPWGSVPFAWYIDRLDHAPSIVYAMSMVEGSCIICAALGTAIGSFLTLKMALLVEFLGRGVTTMLIAIFLLPESLPEEKRVPFSWSSLTPTAALQLLLQSPVVEKLTAIGVINAFHWAGYYTLFGRFLQSHMAWTRPKHLHWRTRGASLPSLVAFSWRESPFADLWSSRIDGCQHNRGRAVQHPTNAFQQTVANLHQQRGAFRSSYHGLSCGRWDRGQSCFWRSAGHATNCPGTRHPDGRCFGAGSFRHSLQVAGPNSPWGTSLEHVLIHPLWCSFRCAKSTFNILIEQAWWKGLSSAKKDACRSSCSLPGGLVLIWDPWATIATQRTKHIIRYDKYNLIRWILTSFTYCYHMKWYKAALVVLFPFFIFVSSLFIFFLSKHVTPGFVRHSCGAWWQMPNELKPWSDARWAVPSRMPGRVLADGKRLGGDSRCRLYYGYGMVMVWLWYGYGMVMVCYGSYGSVMFRL